MIGKSFFSLFLLISISFNSYANEDLKNVIRDSENLKSISSATSSPTEDDCDEPQHQLLNVSIQEISEKIGPELSKKRTSSNFMRNCFAQMERPVPDSFEAAIEFAVDSHLIDERKNEFGVVGAYQANTFKKPISLTNSPMCETVDVNFIAPSKSIKKQTVTKFQNKQIAFEKTYNNLRESYLLAIQENQPKDVIQAKLDNLKKFYYSLLASTAQHESLSTADNTTSRRRADEFASAYNVTDYSKAPGVKFYFDPTQGNVHSKRNIGLYQFSSNREGNVSTCIKSWNKTYGENYPSCNLNIKQNKDLFRMLAASDQVFSAYCGASKLVQSLGVQVNSTVAFKGIRQRTHKDNINKNGTPKAPENRCVSLFSYSLHTYNHFGTLGHTVKIDSNGEITNTSNINNVESTNTSKLLDETLEALGLESPK